jgi:hypothetical protein
MMVMEVAYPNDAIKRDVAIVSNSTGSNAFNRLKGRRGGGGGEE